MMNSRKRSADARGACTSPSQRRISRRMETKDHQATRMSPLKRRRATMKTSRCRRKKPTRNRLPIDRSQWLGVAFALGCILGLAAVAAQSSRQQDHNNHRHQVSHNEQHHQVRASSRSQTQPQHENTTEAALSPQAYIQHHPKAASKSSEPSSRNRLNKLASGLNIKLKLDRPAEGELETQQKQFESILALAANAAKVGAIVADQQPRNRKSQTMPRSNQALALDQSEQNDLAKSKMISSGPPLAPPLTTTGQSSPPAHKETPPGPKQRKLKPMDSLVRSNDLNAKLQRQDLAAGRSNSNATLASSDDFTSGFELAQEVPPMDARPQQQQMSFPEITPGQEHELQQQEPIQQEEPLNEHRQHPELAEDSDLESYHPQPQYVKSIHESRPHLSAEDRASLLDDFHVVNSLPSALADHQAHPQYQQTQSSLATTDLTPLRHHPNIRVVFNNNPQFIIGSEAHGSLGGATESQAGSPFEGYAAAASSLLPRKPRQPSPTLYDDQYHQDESAPSETKVSAVPCSDQPQKTSISREPAVMPVVVQQQVSKSTKSVQQFEEPQQVQKPLAPVKSKAPPPQQPVDQQQQQQHQEDQVVDTPFEQIVKSGMRPPLRMVISMRNKQGHVMKVPVNLQGSGLASGSKVTQQVAIEAPPTKQMAIFELEPQMQIQSKRPSVEVQTREPIDENTPVGGDIFDPSLTKPFDTKSGRKSSTDKTNLFMAMQREMQQQQQVEDLPVPQALEEPAKTQMPDMKAPPPTQPPSIKQQQQQQQKTHLVATERPNCKQVTQQEDLPTKTQEEVPAMTPQRPQVQQQEEKTVEQHPQAILPMSMTSQQNDGMVHMMTPKLTQARNHTLANMISEFQQALSEHMTNHLTQEEADKTQQQQQQDDNQEDLMVALMAANMEPNGGGDQYRQGNDKQQRRQPMSMTVIKPPKGTSIQEAVMSHAKAGQTMAILSSRMPSGLSGMEAGNSLQAPPSAAPAASAETTPFGFDLRLRHSNTPNRTPNINNNQPDPPSSGGVDPDGFSSSSSTRLDHASTLALSVALEDTTDKDNRQEAMMRMVDFHQPSHRFKRQALADAEVKPKLGKANLTIKRPWSDRKLEADTLQKATNTSKSARRLTKSSLRVEDKQRKRKQSKHKQKSRTKSLIANKDGPNKRLVKKMGSFSDEDLKQFSSEQMPMTNDKTDDFEAAASQQSEAPAALEDDDEDDSEGDGESNLSSSDSNDEPAPAASSGGGSSSEGNASPDDGDYNGDMGDDFEDTSSFDSDDEPYNQAAASDRDDSDASSTFEIPSIDINPNTLQQKGCRTVLREVQEIPMNGLGAVQADGKPGSGYGSGGGHEQTTAATTQLRGLRVRRQATGENSNLINSRKVTSIVMTKECHFPNDQTEPSKGESARTQPVASRLATSSPGQRVEPVALGGQIGASQARLSTAHPIARPLSKSPAYQVVKETPRTGLLGLLARTSLQRIASPRQDRLHIYVPTTPRAATLKQPLKQQHQQQLVQFHLAPQTVQKQQNVQPSASSNIQRRSIAPQELLQQQTIANKKDSLLSSAASDVVAKKLYKPPSEDDPYHTLSYSSQTGADPDMEQDEDDSVVMGSDEGVASQEASSRKKPRETLSDRERAALMDPNHDDTDPIFSGGTGRAMPSASSQSHSGEVFDRPDQSDDADEGDGDLVEESRPHNQLRQPAAAHSHSATGQRPASPSRNLPQPDQRLAKLDQTSSGIVSDAGLPRYGKSFRFEHELSRPASNGHRKSMPSSGDFNAAEQLRHLRPGLQGYVATNGQREPSSSVQLANQLRALAARPPIGRRQDMDEDDDNEDDDDGDGERGGGRGRHPAASSSQRRQHLSSASHAAEENPDADPELNPRELRLPTHSKPKKFEKSFAYVHRDLPKEGARNPDDFVVSYGRGNVQTEHEDYDSDRDQHPREDQDRAASSVRRQQRIRQLRGHRLPA